MKKRNIGLCILFTILSCGIYGLYWFIRLTDEVNAATKQKGTSGILALVLSVVTCGIYGVYWAYKMGTKVDMIKTSRDIPSSNTGLVYLLLTLFGVGIVAFALIQNELNDYMTSEGIQDEDKIEDKTMNDDK